MAFLLPEARTVPRSATPPSISNVDMNSLGESACLTGKLVQGFCHVRSIYWFQCPLKVSFKA
jgi:hypothetical protein